MVGVGGMPKPMNDFVLPCERKVATRGVADDGNGTGTFKFEVRVIVDGVRVVNVGDGGNKKRVWDGVADIGCDWLGVLDGLRR